MDGGDRLPQHRGVGANGPLGGCPAPISAWVGVYMHERQEYVDALAMDGGDRLPQCDNCKFYGARQLRALRRPWTGGIGSSTRCGPRVGANGPLGGCPAPISAWVGVYMHERQEYVDALAMDGGDRLPQCDNCKFYGARQLRALRRPWTRGIGSSTRCPTPCSVWGGDYRSKTDGQVRRHERVPRGRPREARRPRGGR